jgi:hypothetical protein
MGMHSKRVHEDKSQIKKKIFFAECQVIVSNSEVG